MLNEANFETDNIEEKSSASFEKEIDLVKQAQQLNKGRHPAVEDAEFYRTILDLQNEYVVVWQTEGVIRYCNQNFAKIIGLPVGQIIGGNFEPYVHPADLKYVKDQLQKILQLDKQNPVLTFEYRVRKKDGEYFRQEWTHRVLYSGDTRSGFLSVGRDISSRRLADTAFIEAEETYGLLFKHSLDAIFLISEDGKIIASNYAASIMFGWSKEELLNFCWRDIVNIKDESLTNVLVEWRNSEIYKGEFTMVRKGGGIFPAEVTCVSFPEKNGIKRISLVVRDISNRKRTQEELKQAYNRLSYHINNSPLAVIEWDGDSRLQFWSKGAEKVFGWKAEEVVGKVWHDWNFTHVDDREFVRVAADQLREGVSNYHVLVNRNYTKDNRVVICRWHNTAMMDEKGGGLSVLSLIQDITEQSETESALIESEERYRCLFQNNRSVMLLLDGETGDILDANAAASNFYGYSREQMIGMNINYINTRETVNVHQELLKADRLDKKHFFFRHRLKDGEERDVEIFSGSIHIKGRQLLYAIVHDITERLKVERALHLEMDENARLLAQANRQAQERQDIFRLSESLRAAETCSEVYPILTERVSDILKAQAGALAILEKSKLNFVSGYGKWESIINIQHESGMTIFKDVISDGKVVFIEAAENLQKVHENSIYQSISKEIHSMAFIPVQVGTNVIGLFIMGYDKVSNFSKHYEALAKEISEIAGITLQRLQILESLERLVKDRTRELDTLFNVTSVARKTLNLTTSLEGALNQIRKVMGNLAGAIYLINENNLALELVIQQEVPDQILELFSQIEAEHHPNVWVLKKGETLFLSDMAGNPNFPLPEEFINQYAFLGVPLRVGGLVVGVLNVFRAVERAFNVEEITLISAIADHLGLIVENVRLHKQAEQAAIMEERARLARDLHDSATQYLYSITLYTEAGRALFEKGDYKQVERYINRLAEISHQALKEIRLLVYELRPPALDEDGIIGALKKRLDAVEERARVKASLVSENVIVLPRTIEEGLYKIALEALNNALKYAEASEVSVHICQQENWVILTVQDNGKGFDMDMVRQKGGMGLSNMHERAEKMGGILKIDTGNGNGTTISASVPVTEENKSG